MHLLPLKLIKNFHFNQIVFFLDTSSEVKCPISILGAETDHLSPPELVKQYEAVLAEKSEVSYLTKFVTMDK